MMQKKFSARYTSILSNLILYLAPIPKSLERPDRQGFLIDSAIRLVNEMTLLMRIAFKLALNAIDLMPLFMGFGFKTFKKLKADSQEKYIDAWAKSKVGLKKEIFSSVKSFISLVVFSDEQIWPHLGYFPQQHINERIEKREKLTHETGANSYN